MVPDPHRMRHTEARTSGGHPGNFGRAFGAQPVIHGHRFDPKPCRQRQMQKGGDKPAGY